MSAADSLSVFMDMNGKVGWHGAHLSRTLAASDGAIYHLVPKAWAPLCWSDRAAVIMVLPDSLRSCYAAGDTQAALYLAAVVSAGSSECNGAAATSPHLITHTQRSKMAPVETQDWSLLWSLTQTH